MTGKYKIRLLASILNLMFFASCGQLSENGSIEKTSKLVSDTLTAGNYLLAIESADSFPTTHIYGDLDYRLKLTDTIDNWHIRAEKIESYLTSKFGQYFFATDSTLVLKLSDGNTILFPKWDNIRDEGYNLEHYFDNIGYFLLRVQWSEGNCWMLVNRKNGSKKYINGLPYISKDHKKILAINADLEAGYSFNGIELYTILADSLRTEFSKETEWGPIDVKWISSNQFLVRREHLNIDSITGKQENVIDYRRVTIENKVRY